MQVKGRRRRHVMDARNAGKLASTKQHEAEQRIRSRLFACLLVLYCDSHFSETPYPSIELSLSLRWNHLLRSGNETRS